MTINKINKYPQNILINLSKLLEKEYNPKHAIRSIFSAKEKKYVLIKRNNYIEAAVLCILLSDKENLSLNNAKIILTVRSKNLKNHAGQVSFPGGKLDKLDKNLTECSLRETYEEIGIHKSKIQTIGMMNKYITGTGFLITPVIAILKEEVKYNINLEEVEKMIFFPLKVFKEVAGFKKSYFSNEKNEKFLYYDYTWKNYRIWGTTALILYDIYKILTNTFKKTYD